MGTLGNKPAAGFQSIEKQSITGNGGTSYALDHAVTNVNDLEVFVNNVRQEPTTAYTLSGQNIVMSEAIANTDSFYVIYQSRSFTKAVPADTSITTGMLQNSAVTDAKIGAMAASKLTGALPAISGASLTATGGLKSVQVFNTSGTHTYTKPAGIRTVRVTVTGAGGGGGGYGAANDYGAGGGAGGTSIKIIDVSSISTVTVNVGAGGAGGSGNANGSGGGGSSFGSHATGNSGGGGQNGNAGHVAGGAGGSATGGDINVTGGMGNNGVDNDYPPVGNNYRSSYGHGGASYWGGGGRGGAYNWAAQTGQAFGSGGGGGSAANTGGGEAGKVGIVYVEEFA